MTDETTTTTAAPDTTTTTAPGGTDTSTTTTAPVGAWYDSFDDIKSDPALAATAGKFKSPAEALRSISAGWGDNWRETFAGEDAEKLERLQRYQSPKAVIDALVAAQDKIRSGSLKPTLPPTANAQEIAEYRKAHGIPEAPAGYLENLPDGLVIGEEDKPIFESFVAALHAENADPKIAHAAVKWYNGFVEQQEAEAVEADTVARKAAEDTLRAEWGRDYRTNLNVIQSYMDTMPPPVAEALKGARGADGVALFNNPEFSQWFAGFAREANSVQTLVGPDGQKHGQSLEDEIKHIEGFMRTNRADYNRDTKMQQRLLQLYDARIKAQARSGKAA
jgi:hypothetical protein